MLVLSRLPCPPACQVHIPRGGGAHARKLEVNIRSVEEEVQLLQQFDHANIVRYLVRACVGRLGGWLQRLVLLAAAAAASPRC